jgi:hypothetical protein
MAETAEKLERYEVLAGIHYGPNPKWQPIMDDGRVINAHDPKRHILYKTSSIVESTENLEEKFRNKFRKVVDKPTVIVTEARKASASQLIFAGGFQEPDRTFLESLSDSDFERVQRIANRGATEERKKVVSHLGEDVTHLFQIAYDHQFLVFRNAGGKHQVARSGETKPINPKPLDGNKVDEFITTFLKENPL